MFGGDGALVALAPGEQEIAGAALAALRTWSSERLALELRAALVPVADVRAAGHDVRAARFRVSGDGGLRDVLRWRSELGRPRGQGRALPGHAGAVRGAAGPRRGCSCRFLPMRARSGAILSLIALPRDGAASSVRRARRAAGRAARVRGRGGHPVPATGPQRDLAAPRRPWTRASRRRAAGGSRGRAVALLESGVCVAPRRTGRPMSASTPGRTTPTSSLNADFRKFDDGLKLTVDVPDAACARIEELLAAAARDGVCRYGTHRQDEALMTCIVPSTASAITCTSSTAPRAATRWRRRCCKRLGLIHRAARPGYARLRARALRDRPGDAVPVGARARGQRRDVREVSAELARRGHRVLIVAPSSSPALVREAPQARARGRRAAACARRRRAAAGRRRRGRAAGAPGARGRRCRSTSRARSGDLFERTPLDLCHVHEPFAPSVSAAPRCAHSRALNVGSFHAPQERLVATQVARKVVELMLGRLDARTPSYETTARADAAPLPRSTTSCCARRSGGAARAAPRTASRVRIVFTEDEERPALRLLLRALRAVDAALAVGARRAQRARARRSTPLRADLRERVRYVDAAATPLDELLSGRRRLRRRLGRARRRARRCSRARPRPASVPVAARLPVYEEVLGDGERGLLFDARDGAMLAAQLTRLIDDEALRARLARAPRSRAAVGARRRRGRGALRARSPPGASR